MYVYTLNDNNKMDLYIIFIVICLIIIVECAFVCTLVCFHPTYAISRFGNYYSSSDSEKSIEEEQKNEICVVKNPRGNLVLGYKT